MQGKTHLFDVAGLRVTAGQSALIGFMVLWFLFAVFANLALELTVPRAAVAGLLAALLYNLSSLIHQIGHSIAARRTGHPMTGVHFTAIMSRSIYPRDEGELPAAIHIRRALGGPIISALVAVIALGAALLLPAGTLLYGLVLFFVGCNIVIFVVVAFLPLGFTDGSTLLYWWPRR